MHFISKMNEKAWIIKGIVHVIIRLQRSLLTPGACKLIIEPINRHCVLANGRWCVLCNRQTLSGKQRIVYTKTNMNSNIHRSKQHGYLLIYTKVSVALIQNGRRTVVLTFARWASSISRWDSVAFGSGLTVTAMTLEFTTVWFLSQTKTEKWISFLERDRHTLFNCHWGSNAEQSTSLSNITH